MPLGQAGAAEITAEDMERYSDAVVFGKTPQKTEALAAFRARGKKDVIAALILGFRYRQNDQAILQTITELSGAAVNNWRDAMEWQEDHPEISPHPSYRTLKLKIFNRIDPNFMRFLGGDKSLQQNLGIRFEEIVWGGVRVDGIPSLDGPDLITADDAGYLVDEDLVFGVEINGDVRAYPLRIMGWHEMFNETIGGVPVALAYCTLCGAGILFETQVEGRDQPLVFGSSGFLYRSNKLMFDRQTDSLWNQFTGEPVSGALFGSGIQLKIRPVTITSWGQWRSLHPKTKVLSVETGHARDYSSGNVYRDYFASPDLMFPVIVRNETQLKRKDYVFGIRQFGVAKAWPVTAFSSVRVINDQIGANNLVLIGDAQTRTVRAYQRGDRVFTALGADGTISDGTGPWQITENALVAADAEKLARVAGHISYWFAWDSYLGLKSELYASP
ncbi:MAG: DUF3179 domain-containing protein [Rhodospirillales bacterium]|nr:DUF3179 domain-containing protein [Rhodospirillales bacterium]